MIERCSSLRRLVCLSRFVAAAAIILNASAAAAESPASGQSFAVLAGTAVTCTDGTIKGDVGVWPVPAITPTNCVVTGTVHTADAAAKQAFLDFQRAFEQLRLHPPACVHLTTQPINPLAPAVYCFDAPVAALAGTLYLDAGHNPNATWLFLVNGALTGTNFTVALLNGAQACNVGWWVKDAATLTDSTFAGSILAGAAITVTRGTLKGNAWASTAVTLTGPTVSGCQVTVPSAGPAMCVDDRGHDGDHHGDDHDDGLHGDKGHDKDRKDNDHKDKDHDNDRKDHNRKAND